MMASLLFCNLCVLSGVAWVLGVGVRRVRVIMIGRWSEGSVCTVRHVVFCSSVGEQKVMSGEDVW